MDIDFHSALDFQSHYLRYNPTFYAYTKDVNSWIDPLGLNINDLTKRGYLPETNLNHDLEHIKWIDYRYGKADGHIFYDKWT